MSFLAAFAQNSQRDERYSIDYSCWLDPGETIRAVEVHVHPQTTPKLDVHDIAVASGLTGVTFYVTGGQEDTLYDLKVTVLTNADRQKVSRQRIDCASFEIIPEC